MFAGVVHGVRPTLGLLPIALIVAPIQAQVAKRPGPAPAIAVIKDSVKGVGLMNQLASTPPVVLVKVGGKPIRGAAVTLELRDSNGVVAIDGDGAVTDARGVARFDSLKARSLVSRAYPGTVIVGMLVRVGGHQVTGDTAIEYDIRPPTKATIVVLQPLDSISLGIPFSVTARVTSDTLQLAGAAVQLALPDGKTVLATTDGGGIALFTGVTIAHGTPGKASLKLTTAAPLAASSNPVVLNPGSVSSLVFTPASDTKISIGKTFTIALQAHDSAGNPVTITAHLAADRVQAAFEPSIDTVVITKGKGSWSGRYYGPLGAVQLSARSDNVVATLAMTASTGNPNQLQIIQDVAGRFIADSTLERPLIVRVADSAGNAVAGVAVQVALCKLPEWKKDSVKRSYAVSYQKYAAELRAPRSECEDGSQPVTKEVPPFVRGTQRKVSDSTGQVRFDSLRVEGPTGRYQLKLTAENCVCTASSGVMDYDANDAFDHSFVIVSAIKSIAGADATGESFDVRFQFRLMPHFHALIQTDLPLVRKSSNDSNPSAAPERDVIDAQGAVTYAPWRGMVRDRLTETPDRYLFVGAGVRLFNTVPYAELRVGSMELTRSIFYGSSMTIGYAWAMDNTPVTLGDEIFRPSEKNVVIEAFLRSSGIDFFKLLNVRATIFLPIGAKGQRPTSRIVIAVPVGGLIPF